MTKSILVLTTFFLYLSCSNLEQGGDRFSFRKIASGLKENEIRVNVDEQTIDIMGKVSLFRKRDGHNEFNFPLYKLESPYFKEVPYHIMINNQYISCVHSSNISRVEEGKNYFKVSNYQFGDYLKCKIVGAEQGSFNFIYQIPKLKPFEVSEASYMRGFYPDIVSNMELSLAKIYKKLVPDNGGAPQKLYYRERELLMKYVPDIVWVDFDPRKKEMQFSTELDEQDLFELSDIEGEIKHPKHGKIDYTGFENDDYQEFGWAGKKYLKPKGVKPFALFCEKGDQNFDFEYTNELIISDPGKINCSINSRYQGFMGFRVVKGSIKAKIKILRIKKAIKNLPRYYLNKAKKAISKRIEKMNDENTKRFTEGINKKLDERDREVKNMLAVDKTFPFNIEVNASLKSINTYSKPFVRHENKNGKDSNFLSYSVFYKKKFVDQEQKEFNSSEILLGVLHTDKVLKNIKDIKQYTLVYNINPSDYDAYFLKDLKKYFDNNKTIKLKTYKNMLSLYESRAKKYPDSLVEQNIELNRFGLYICGQISYYTKRKVKYEKLILSTLKARYDLFEGGHVNSSRVMFPESFYEQQKQMDQSYEVLTKVKYIKDSGDENHCFYVSAEDFANEDYERSILLKSI